MFDRMFSYLDSSKMNAKEKLDVPDIVMCKHTVDVSRSGNEISENWKFSISGGYAKRILYEQGQRTIPKIQNEIGFRYIRIKAIFADEHQVCTRNLNGKLARYRGQVP